MWPPAKYIGTKESVNLATKDWLGTLNLAANILYWDTNRADVMSCENGL